MNRRERHKMAMKAIRALGLEEKPNRRRWGRWIRIWSAMNPDTKREAVAILEWADLNIKIDDQFWAGSAGPPGARIAGVSG